LFVTAWGVGRFVSKTPLAVGRLAPFVLPITILEELRTFAKIVMRKVFRCSNRLTEEK
jgi:hypothetical protein